MGSDPDPLHPDRVERVVTADGAALHVAVRGSGPPVVLVHGVTLTADVWVRQFTTLADRGVTVVAYDQRGHGRSGAGTEPWSMATFGRDLRDVLVALALSDVVVVGHSMGGIVAQVLLIEHPEVVAARVGGVVLLSSTVSPKVGLTRSIRLATRRLLPGFDPARVMANRTLGTLLARVGFGRAPRAADVELTRRLLASCDPDTSREAVRAIFEFDGTVGLGRVRVPTLVVGGSRDLITPPSDAVQLTRAIPGARLVELHAAGHMAMLERVDELDALLLEFVGEVVAGFVPPPSPPVVGAPGAGG